MITPQEGLKRLDAGPDRVRRDERQRDRRTASAGRRVGGRGDSGQSGQYGYLSEHHSFGETDQKAGDYAEDLAAMMLATILGVDFDPNASYDERKDIWRVSDKIVTTRNVTQSAIGDRDGLWTSVVAAAVFVDFPDSK